MTDDCNPIEQQARQDLLEGLYAADGRHDHGHPMHGLYTGLMLAFRQQQEGQQ
jgi:hypothetical protein